MPRKEIVLAILIDNGQYLLQLRDDKPGITYPGVWGLFGGGREDDEEIHETLIREIKEELNITLADYYYLWCEEYYDAHISLNTLYHIFFADISDQVGLITLFEGQAIGNYLFCEIFSLQIAPYALYSLVRFQTRKNFL